MKKTLFLTCALSLCSAMPAQSFYFENSTPHNATAAGAPIDCRGCHDEPAWGSSQANRNPYLLNKQADACEFCHNNKTGQNFMADQAPYVKTHSKETTKSKKADWGEKCWDCHKNHSDPPTSTPLVTGTYSNYAPVSWTNPLTGTTITGTSFTYSSATPTDPAWSDPGMWMNKDNFQSPYNSDADKNSSSWSTSPCNPKNFNPNNPPDEDLCDPGIYPGERGLNFWVTYSDGSKGAFEIVAANSSTITVSGRIPEGKTLSKNGNFDLHYGMLVSTTPRYDDDKNPSTPMVPVSTSVDYSGHFKNFSTLAYNERPGGADPDPTPNGICQVCHTETKYWRKDGTRTSHKNGLVCTKCHKHAGGFAPSDCDGCHTRPPNQGAHVTHASSIGYNFPCSSCHNGPDAMLTQFIDGGNVDMGFDPHGLYDNPADSTDNDKVRPRDLIYYGVQGTNYKGEYGWSSATPSVYDSKNFNFGTQVVTVPANDSKANTCQNVYCHSQGKLFAQGYETPSTSPNWNKTWANGGDPQNDGNICNNCHAYPPTFDSHTVHISRAVECYHCHYKTTYKDLANGGATKIRDKSLHVNGKYDVDAGGEFILPSYPPKIVPVVFNYTPVPEKTYGGGTCSSNQCHVMVGFEKKYDLYGNPLNIVRQWSTYKQVHKAGFNFTQAGTCTKGGKSTTVSATITSTCKECTAPYTYEINWGDGSPISTATVNTTTWTVKHTYSDKVPAAYETDSSKGVIGTWKGTWTVKDVYGIMPETSDGTGITSVLIDACPVNNMPPVANFSVANTNYTGAPSYEVELTDMSSDPDYNQNQHYDQNGPAPGMIKVEWGGYAPGSTKKGITEQQINLTDTPSGQKLKFTYSSGGYAVIKHCIKDNDAASNYVCSPTQTHYVSR